LDEAFARLLENCEARLVVGQSLLKSGTAGRRSGLFPRRNPWPAKQQKPAAQRSAFRRPFMRSPLPAAPNGSWSSLA
jgi:hypothetical protein